MGCLLSSPRSEGSGYDHGESATVVVFAPALRVPCSPADFAGHLSELVPSQTLEDLGSLQNRIMELAPALAADLSSTRLKSVSKSSATQLGGTTIVDFQQTIEDYIQLLLGLGKGSQTTNLVQFTWRNQEDDEQETSLSDIYYEVLSALHVLAVLELKRANLLLSPKSSDDYQTKNPVDRKKEAIDILLKVSGILECAVKTIIPKLSEDSKSKLPTDLKEDVLYALSMEALGQTVEIQLGLAIENMKATLAVKRRIACELVKYWQKAYENFERVPIGGYWGSKHQLYISWKLAEAKAAAYYFHGLILDEGSEEGSHAKAVLCLQTSDSSLKESQKLCTHFCLESPITRAYPIWGAMKYLTEKIPRDYVNKTRILKEMYSREKFPNQVPELPEFPLSLNPEEYCLPSI